MDPTLVVREFVFSNFYVPETTVLSDEASLLDHGVIDSTGVLEVIAFIERTFQIRVQDEEILPENLDSVARISAYVQRKRG
jgi:acyl carrier protein